MLATGAMADARAWNKAGITNHVKDSKRRPVSNLRVQSASPVRESSPRITLRLHKEIGWSFPSVSLCPEADRWHVGWSSESQVPISPLFSSQPLPFLHGIVVHLTPDIA